MKTFTTRHQQTTIIYYASQFIKSKVVQPNSLKIFLCKCWKHHSKARKSLIMHSQRWSGGNTQHCFAICWYKCLCIPGVPLSMDPDIGDANTRGCCCDGGGSVATSDWWADDSVHPSPEKGYTSKSGFIISTKATFWTNSSWFRIWCWLIQNYPKLLR